MSKGLVRAAIAPSFFPDQDLVGAASECIAQAGQGLQVNVAGHAAVQPIDQVFGHTGDLSQAAERKPLTGSDLMFAQQDGDTSSSAYLAHNQTRTFVLSIVL
jgi:hypothetical protein